jgi:hypothetical protein
MEEKSIEEKLDEVDHLLIVLRVINREQIADYVKNQLKTLIVKQINEILK